MQATPTSLSWLCMNIEQNLDRIDAVLAEILDETAGPLAVEAADPWVERLFERRRGLQSTLAEIERQIQWQLERNPA